MVLIFCGQAASWLLWSSDIFAGVDIVTISSLVVMIVSRRDVILVCICHHGLSVKAQGITVQEKLEFIDSMHRMRRACVISRWNRIFSLLHYSNITSPLTFADRCPY